MRANPNPKLIPITLLLLAVVAGIFIFWERPSDLPTKQSGSKQSSTTQTDSANPEAPTNPAPASDTDSGIRRADVGSAAANHGANQNGASEDVGTLVRVFDAQGQPAVGASVFPWLGAELWRERITNEQGEAWVEGLRGAGGLVVKLPGWRPGRKMMVFNGQEIDWHQQDGVAVSGRLVCEQIPGDFPPLLLLLRDHDWRPSWENIPRAVFDSLDDLGWNLAMVPMEVQADGSFRLDGLAAGWRGKLELPPGYFAVALKGPGEVEGPEEVNLFEPADGLVLEIMQLPEVTGQLLIPDGSGPAAGVSVHVSMTFPGGAETPPLRGVSDEDGRFRLPLILYSHDAHADWIERARVPAALNIQVKTFTAEIGDSVNLELNPADLENPWELGQITLARRQSLPFHAVDPKGNPIANAYGYAGEISSPTDREGFGEVYIPQEGKVVAFMAKGFSMLEYHIPKDLQPPAVVELQPANQVSVQVELPERLEMNVRIQALASGQLFGDSQFRRDSRTEMDDVLGADYREYSFGNSEREQTYWFLPAGVKEFHLVDLKPGVEFVLQLIDTTSTVLASSALITMKAGEQRHVELKVTSALHHLWGRVLDPTGQPVGDVQLQVQSIGGAGAWAETTADGRFDFGWLQNEEVQLQISKEGFAKSYWLDFQISTENEAVDLMLSPLRELRLHVVDVKGRNLGEAHIAYGMRWREDYASWLPQEQHHLAETAPVGAFEVQLRVGGLRTNRLVPADVTDFDLVVDQAGAASLHLQREQADRSWMAELTFKPTHSSVEPMPDSIHQRISISEGEMGVEVSMPALIEGSYQVYATISTGGDWQKVMDGVLVKELDIKAGEITTMTCDI
jgi:hypothetical protein